MTHVTDVYGNVHECPSWQLCVCATDKYLSGWGLASGRTHKQIILCRNFQQASRVAENLRKDSSFKYVNIFAGVPRYSSTRYTASYRHADDCPLWNK